MTETVLIGPLSTSVRAGRHRVEAEVGGMPLWFESPDAPLAASPEAFAGALWLPTLARGQRLHVADPVCPTWKAHLTELVHSFERWWQYPAILPAVETLPTAAAPPAAGIGLCFTGGVDSFYSLLHSPQRIDTLIYILDYDVPPQVPERYSRYEPHMRRLAAELQARAVLVWSNFAAIRVSPARPGNRPMVRRSSLSDICCARQSAVWSSLLPFRECSTNRGERTGRSTTCGPPRICGSCISGKGCAAWRKFGASWTIGWPSGYLRPCWGEPG